MRRFPKNLLLILTALFSLKSGAGEPQAGYATVDWSVAETLIALGQPPLAVGDVKSYQTWVMAPQLPENTLDLGIRLQPNMERIAALPHFVNAQPLSFIHSSFYAALNDKLAPYGNVYNVEFYKAGNAWGNVVAATQEIGRIIDKPEAVQKLLANYSQDIAYFRPLVASFTDRPVALVQFIDTRHLRIYG